LPLICRFRRGMAKKGGFPVRGQLGKRHHGFRGGRIGSAVHGREGRQPSYPEVGGISDWVAALQIKRAFSETHSECKVDDWGEKKETIRKLGVIGG